MVVQEDALEEMRSACQVVEPGGRREGAGEVALAAEAEELALHRLQLRVLERAERQAAQRVEEVEVRAVREGRRHARDPHLVLEPVAVERLAEEGHERGRCSDAVRDGLEQRGLLARVAQEALPRHPLGGVAVALEPAEPDHVHVDAGAAAKAARLGVEVDGAAGVEAGERRIVREARKRRGVGVLRLVEPPRAVRRAVHGNALRARDEGASRRALLGEARGVAGRALPARRGGGERVGRCVDAFREERVGGRALALARQLGAQPHRHSRAG
ncbi:MAG: hypothetical protein AAFZ87_07175, partial [Planctomycetota bacterium]